MAATDKKGAFPAFNEAIKCMMCGFPNIQMLFCEKEHNVGESGPSSQGNQTYREAVKGGTPHMHRQCNRCGYAWLEGPRIPSSDTATPEKE